MSVFVLAVFLLQDSACRGEAARHIADAVRLGESFNLIGAAAAYEAAAQSGCETARVAAVYVRGLVAAREADAQFGSAAALQPLKQAIAVLEPRTAADPVGRAMQAVLMAAIPAAQNERPEMTLRIEEMLRMESLQLEAKQPPLPVVSAHEAAGYLWLQLHLYDEARRAFDAAAQRVGRTSHVLLGLARSARGRFDVTAACGEYARLLAWWGDRTETPAEIIEARDYVNQPLCIPTPARSPARSGVRP